MYLEKNQIKLNNFANFTDNKSKFNLPYANDNNSKKANNVFSDLLAMNRNKNTKNAIKNTINDETVSENSKSRPASDDYSTKDNSIAVNYDNLNSNAEKEEKLNQEKADLKVIDPIKTKKSVANDNPTPNAKRSGWLRAPNRTAQLG